MTTLGVWLLAAGYLVVACFFAAQRLLRRTESARSLRGGTYDRGSTLLVGSATGLAIVLPLPLGFFGVAAFPVTLPEGLVALGVMVLGLGIRVWAAAALGRYYTSTLTTVEGQSVVTTGPYALLRHPGYLGSILLWTGFAALSFNLVLLFAVPLMFVAVYSVRMGAEETMLARELGEDYVLYMRKTRRLIPYVY